MIQLSVSSTAACDSLQIGRLPFLNRALRTPRLWGDGVETDTN